MAYKLNEVTTRRLVRHQTVCRNISHLRLALQLAINLLLIAAVFVKARYLGLLEALAAVSTPLDAFSDSTNPPR
jgi:hypothetical protein